MKRRVSDVMTTEVITILQDHEVHEAERLFLTHQIHGAPIVDLEGRLVGVLTQTDLIAWHYGNAVDGTSFFTEPTLWIGDRGSDHALGVSDIRNARVSEVMTPIVHTVSPGESIKTAAEQMIRNHVHRLVVTDDEHRVVGIVSALDLLRLIPGVAMRITNHSSTNVFDGLSG
ncbi:MAG: CBS domain-containing protein [Acidobacteriota bacterium]|nr:MAG: CBS domain-containing protein [Acidobacteriota bacterium]